MSEDSGQALAGPGEARGQVGLSEKESIQDIAAPYERNVSIEQFRDVAEQGGAGSNQLGRKVLWG